MATLPPAVSSGNTKLGKCDILNRAVGNTCSPTCPYLTGIGVPKHAKCYAKSTEQRFDDARACGESNARVGALELRQALESCAKRGRAFRFHERGDFGNGKAHQVDGRYVLAIERALDGAERLPAMWSYTHIYHQRLSALTERGLTMYASVHNAEQIDKAESAGFRLFALVLPERVQGKCKPQIRALPEHDGSAYVERHGRRWLVCPAQRDHKLTCDKCGYCVHGRGNVAFLTH
jgi:hypothetical protein